MTGAKREPVESIGEFQAHRKPVESLDDNLVVPSMDLHPEHHKSLKEKDFRKLRTTEEDFVFPYGSHASFFVCRSFPVVFFNISGISFNSGVHYDRLAVRAEPCTVYGFPNPPFSTSAG